MRGRRAAVFAAAAGVVAGACGSGHQSSAPPTRAPVDSTSVSTSATAAPATTTTVDPGALPQTPQVPSTSDPGFLARIDDLWQAVVTGNADLAAPAFFPLSAYVQVKGISDPMHDYQTRLIPDFDQDIAALHTQVPAGAVFASVSVPNAAEWILPGVEYNKGSYWRVYGARVLYDVGGATRSFAIASMISWRGEWYVVHLGSIR